MGIRVSFFHPQPLSPAEILQQQYPAFRQWALDTHPWDFPNAPVIEKAFDRVLAFMLDHETFSTAEKTDEELVNQLSVGLWADYFTAIHEKEFTKYLGSLLKLQNYQDDLGLLDIDVAYGWNFLIHGRSVTEPGHFFHAIEDNGFRLGYWTPVERKHMTEKINKLYRRNPGRGLSAVADVLNQTVNTEGYLVFTIS